MNSLRDDIANLVHRYADAVVRRDGDQWGNTWADDASWKLTLNRHVNGRADIVELWTKAMGGFTAVVQNVVNGEVTADPSDPTRASGRWYIIEHFNRREGGPGMLLAYYDDTYVQVDGSWCFASRMLVVQYQGPPDLTAPFLNAVE
jgi:SnoaL-like domain